MGALKTTARWCKACAVGTSIFVSLACAAIVVAYMVMSKMPDAEGDAWAEYEASLNDVSNVSTSDDVNGTRLLREVADEAFPGHHRGLLLPKRLAGTFPHSVVFPPRPPPPPLPPPSSFSPS